MQHTEQCVSISPGGRRVTPETNTESATASPPLPGPPFANDRRIPRSLYFTVQRTFASACRTRTAKIPCQHSVLLRRRFQVVSSMDVLLRRAAPRISKCTVPSCLEAANRRFVKCQRHVLRQLQRTFISWYCQPAPVLRLHSNTSFLYCACAKSHPSASALLRIAEIIEVPQPGQDRASAFVMA